LLRRRATQAKIAAFTPHDLRRSFICDLLDAGADMVTPEQGLPRAGMCGLRLQELHGSVRHEGGRGEGRVPGARGMRRSVMPRS